MRLNVSKVEREIPQVRVNPSGRSTTRVVISLLAVVIVSMGSALLVSTTWPTVWGDVDLWIPGTLLWVEACICVATLLVSAVLEAIGRFTLLVPLIAVVIVIGANIVFLGIAFGDLPDTAFE